MGIEREEGSKDILFVMQEVVRLIVGNISEYTSAEHSGCGVPIVVKDCVSELVKWSCKN